MAGIVLLPRVHEDSDKAVDTDIEDDAVGDPGLHEPIRFSTDKIQNSLDTVGIVHHTPDFWITGEPKTPAKRGRGRPRKVKPVNVLYYKMQHGYIIANLFIERKCGADPGNLFEVSAILLVLVDSPKMRLQISIKRIIRSPLFNGEECLLRRFGCSGVKICLRLSRWLSARCLRLRLGLLSYNLLCRHGLELF